MADLDPPYERDESPSDDGTFIINLPDYHGLVDQFRVENPHWDGDSRQLLNAFMDYAIELQTNLSFLTGKVLPAAAFFASGHRELEELFAERVIRSKVLCSENVPRDTFEHLTCDDVKERLIGWLISAHDGASLAIPLVQCLPDSKGYALQSRIIDALIKLRQPTFFPDYSEDILYPDLKEKYAEWHQRHAPIVADALERYSKAAKASSDLRFAPDDPGLVQVVVAGDVPAFCRSALQYVRDPALVNDLVESIYGHRYDDDLSAAAEARGALEYVKHPESQNRLIDTIIAKRDYSNFVEARAALKAATLWAECRERLEAFIREISGGLAEDDLTEPC